MDGKLNYETPIMSMEQFNVGLMENDRIPGLLIRSDENGYYDIGIQINENEVLKVESALEVNAIKKMQYWAEESGPFRKCIKNENNTKISRDGNISLPGLLLTGILKLFFCCWFFHFGFYKT